MANESTFINDNNFPMSCPNNCDKEVTSEDHLEEHLQVCPFENVTFPHCGTRRARKHFEEHEITRKFEPQYCLQRQFDKLQEELEEIITNKFKQAEEEQRETNKRFEQVEQSLTLQSDKLQNQIAADNKRFEQVEPSLKALTMVVALMLLVIISMSSSSGVKGLINVSNVTQQIDELKTNITQLRNDTMVTKHCILNNY